MKQVQAVILIILMICASDYAEASPIRYNITGGTDTEGNAFSGYVDIESNPEFINPEFTNSIKRINYQIGSFLFVSASGFNYGDSGLLTFIYNSAIDTIFAGGSGAQFYNDFTFNVVGKPNYTMNIPGEDYSSVWSNGHTGVWFDDIGNGTFEKYSSLPEQIIICTDLMLGFTNISKWGPGDSHIVLDRVNPVPEPSTILLFGTGLAGLAAVGRRKR